MCLRRKIYEFVCWNQIEVTFLTWESPIVIINFSFSQLLSLVDISNGPESSPIPYCFQTWCYLIKVYNLKNVGHFSETWCGIQISIMLRHYFEQISIWYIILMTLVLLNYLIPIDLKQGPLGSPSLLFQIMLHLTPDTAYVHRIPRRKPLWEILAAYG